MRNIEVSRESWCGSRSAMIVMAFSMVLDPEDIPVKEVTRLHEDLTLTTPVLETKLIELAKRHGLALKFK